MKLTDIGSKPTLKQLNKITESRFGVTVDYSNMTLKRANNLSHKIMETVTRIRNSSAVHTAERNPKYLEMLMIYEGLQRWKDSHQVKTNNMLARRLYESEMGQAEAILAAKDMVDTVQDMMSKISKMQNEQLPALVDVVRDQIGPDQADQFKTIVGQTLSGLIDQLTQTREALDASARGLTGEGLDMQMVNDDPNAQNPEGTTGDEMSMGDEQGPRPDETDGFNATDAAVGGTEPLGREER
jgi:hypothetical protein